MQAALQGKREEEVLERLQRGEGLNDLYDMGRGPDDHSDGGNTILHLAIRYKVSVRVVRAIFEAGFKDLNVLNAKGDYAAEYVFSSQLDVMECCLQHGLDPNIVVQASTCWRRTFMAQRLEGFTRTWDSELYYLFRQVKLLLRYGGDPYVIMHSRLSKELARYLKSIRPLVHMCMVIKRGGGGDGLSVELVRHLATFLR